jgi:hypothetical protein
MNYWKVMEGHDLHTDGLTFDEAVELANELNETFDSYDFVAFPDPDYREVEPRCYNERAVDGWEDIYPDRDY